MLLMLQTRGGRGWKVGVFELPSAGVGVGGGTRLMLGEDSVWTKSYFPTHPKSWRAKRGHFTELVERVLLCF